MNRKPSIIRTFALVALAAGLAAGARAQTPTQPGIAEVDKLAAIAAVPGCGERALPVAKKPTLPAAAFAEMKRYSDSVGGVGLLVLRDGRIEHEAYAAPYGPATRTMSHSMHKSVVALVAGAAIRDGLLPPVDRPVGEAIPAWKDDSRGRIPLRSFLTMSSGLKLYSAARREPEAQRLMMGPDIEAVALANPVEAPPDGVFKYNNANTQIVGTALLRGLAAKGRGDYARYLSDALWCPVGNAPATLWVDDKGTPRFYAGLQATARDWARIGQLVLDRGRVGRRQVLPADWIAAMTAPSKANPQYGYQVWRGTPWTAQRAYSAESPIRVPHKEAYLADDVVFFDGFGGQRVYVVPSSKLVIVRTGEANLAFDDSILVNAALRGLGRSAR